MTQPNRAEVERLWAQHLARPFPPDLRGVAVGDVEVVLLDADIAGFASSWLSSGRLDRDRQRVLAQCMDEARRLATLLTDSTDAAYFAGLQGLARAVLDADEVLSEFPPPRAYLACRWTHSNAEDPVLILSELDGARYEVRKVHQFADGRLERADRITDASTSLAWMSIPSDAEIEANGEFELWPLTADEFEDYWRRAVPVGLPVLTIDGAQFEDFNGFVSRFSGLLDDFEWRGSLDAFNDILRGGCGTPDGGFELRWLNSERSRTALGWPATIRWLENTIDRCHPSNVPRLTAELKAARRGEGTTLFDWIVEIIEAHGPGGAEAEDNVVLRLL
jgi:hypothetical protein